MISYGDGATDQQQQAEVVRSRKEGLLLIMCLPTATYNGHHFSDITSLISKACLAPESLLPSPRELDSFDQALEATKIPTKYHIIQVKFK